jgi:hypothetical protein
MLPLRDSVIAAFGKIGSLGFTVRGSRFGGVKAATPPSHPQIWAIITVVPKEPEDIHLSKVIFMCDFCTQHGEGRSGILI